MQLCRHHPLLTKPPCAQLSPAGSERLPRGRARSWAMPGQLLTAAPAGRVAARIRQGQRENKGGKRPRVHQQRLLWAVGAGGESLRPRALHQHRPAGVGSAAVGRVGACCHLLSQCSDLHGDKGNTRSGFKICSAACSSLGLRKTERRGSDRSDVSGARGYRALRCSVGSEPKAVKRRELRPRSTQG